MEAARCRRVATASMQADDIDAMGSMKSHRVRPRGRIELRDILLQITLKMDLATRTENSTPDSHLSGYALV
jgi:hypothetical protein